MSEGFWGRKLGMTQLFDGDKVLPVTAIDVGHWFVTGVRTSERDGYNALCIGLTKKRYAGKEFSSDWLKKPQQYFTVIREVKSDEAVASDLVGTSFNPCEAAQVGELFDVQGTTRGRGFAGVVKRHNFGGPPGSHGATMGKHPGSIGFQCSNGRVMKGKAMPGHMGAKKRTVKNLRVARIEAESSVVLLVGAIPGHAGSLVFARKTNRGSN